MASAAAASNYFASTGTASSNYVATNSANSTMVPKFNEYRSRVMLGELPQDFLRIEFTQGQIYNAAGYGIRPGYSTVPVQQQQLHHNPNFLGYFTLTIAEAKLVKNTSLLGLMKMDPYVSFRIGHVAYDTPTAAGGGKNPQWKTSYRINLFRGMDNIHIEVFDQRNFTEDSFIGECDIAIPREVMEGETRQHWYPLMGREASANENQGDILIIMSFMPRNDQMIGDLNDQHHNDSPIRVPNQQPAATPSNIPVMNPDGFANFPAGSRTSPLPNQLSNTSEQQQQRPATEHSPSAIPKPPPPPYSPEDVRTIQEMFPTTDRRVITDLLDQHHGNKDLVVNYLLQNMA